MASVRVDTAPLIAGACVVSAYPGHGIRGADVPSAGANGPAILFPGLSLPGEANDEFRALILTRPASLPGLVIGEDSSIDSGAAPADGVHAGTWRGYKNGVVYGPDPSTYTITIGSTGGTLSGGATLDGPAAGGALSGGAASQLSGGAALDGPSAGGGLGGGTPSQLSGDASLDGPAPGGDLGGGAPTQVSGDATIDGMAAEGALQGYVEPVAVIGKRFVIAGKQSTPKHLRGLDVREVDDIAFRFGTQLLAGERVVSYELMCEPRVGTDPRPFPLIVGGPQFFGPDCIQRVDGSLGVPGVTYLLACDALLSSDRVVTAQAYMRVVTYAS